MIDNMGTAYILFGHCRATEDVADDLLSCGITPAAILDNNPSKQGLFYRAIPIVSPEHIRTYRAKDSAVWIASRHFAAMAAQLRRLGYEGEIKKVNEYNSFVEYSLSDETFNRKVERIQRGVALLERVRVRYPVRHLVVCPYNALGDVYWAMAYWPLYRAKNEIGEAAVIVVGDGCRQVAELFGMRDIVVLGGTEMDELVQALIFTREGNCTIAHHDRPYTDNTIEWLNGHFLSFIDYYRYAVYGLYGETVPAVPMDWERFAGAADMPDGRAAILAPYAKSVVQLPISFWEDLVDEYSERGYDLHTHTDGHEAPIRGTKALHLPLAQLKAAAEHAGTFIGIRSGLCDLLHTADCRKIVVFPDCYYSSTPHKVADFFALPGWESIVYG